MSRRWASGTLARPLLGMSRPARVSAGGDRLCLRFSHHSCSQGEPNAHGVHVRRRWQNFCSDWNEVLTKHPVPMLIFYRGTCTLTWAVIFHLLSASVTASAALAHPHYAVGWIVMRSTVKFRQPLNAALAATVSKLIPTLSSLKVSPFLAFFTADAKTQKWMGSARTCIEELPLLGDRGQELTKRCFSGFSRFMCWAEGPIDMYGFSYFLASKFTALVTLSGSTIAACQGFDVSGALSHWGFSSEAQADAGLLACAAGLNKLLVPVHFMSAIRLAQHLEKQAVFSFHAERRAQSVQLDKEQEVGAYPELAGVWLPTRHDDWTRPEQARDARTRERWDSNGRCRYQTAGDQGEIVVESKDMDPHTMLTWYHCRALSGDAVSAPQLLRRTHHDGTHSWDLGAWGCEHWDEKDGKEQVTAADYCRNLLNNVAFIGLLLDVGFTVYVMRRLARARAKKSNNPDPSII